jgi:phenylacetate-CoA ligase
MTEGALIACEGAKRTGSHLWSDLFYCEVVDEATGEPVNEGEIGTLAMTPLWNNSVTPFLRWNSGDLISIVQEAAGRPLRAVSAHAAAPRRNVGFFLARGVNINHPELEDLMFFEPTSTSSAPRSNDDGGLDVLHSSIEVKRGVAEDAATAKIISKVRQTFQVTPRIAVQPPGTIAREFEANVKAARFVDRRG